MRRRFRPAVFGSALAVVTLAGLLAAGGGSGAALADSGPSPVCASGTCTVTYSTPGTGQSFTVPAGVSSVSVTLYGAVGGSSTVPVGTAPGGDGAEVAADLAVAPGQALGLDVGGAGQNGNANNGEPTAGGVNGGGASAAGGGGGGGGDTDLSTAPSGGTLLLEAGGGGGAGTSAYISNETQFNVCVTPPNSPGNYGAGGNADTAGGTGQPLAALSGSGDTIGPGTGGGAGTISGPGAAGNAGVSTMTSADCGSPSAPATLFTGNGSDGTAGSGGAGGAAPAGGGGGGGGYTGGGAGGSGAYANVSVPSGPPPSQTLAPGGGGGGGASYIGGVGGATVTDTGNTGQVSSGNGEVVFSYANPIGTGPATYSTTAGQTLTVPAANGLLSTAAGTTGPAGDALTASGPAGGSTAQGGTLSVNPDGSFSYTPPPGFAGLDSFGYTVADGAGDYTAGTVTLQVLFITQTITFTSTPPGQAEPGDTYAPTATGGGSGRPVIFSIDPSSTSTCSVSGGTVTFTAPGTCTIDANQGGSGVYAPAPQVTQSVTVQLIPQSITFTTGPPSPAVVGSTYTPAASGGPSGQPVVFSIDPASTPVCSISGGTVTFTAAGTCTVDANQAGAGQYASAPQVSQLVTVDLAPSFVQATPHLSSGAGQSYSYVFTATGAPTASYALAKAPSWLTIDPSDGVLSGTPPAGTKSFSYSVTAANTIGTATAGPFLVHVLSAVTSKDLSVKLTCPATVTVGSTGTCTVAVTNSATSAAQLVSVAVSLPAILAESSCTGSCTMTGNVATWQLARLGAGVTRKFSLTVAATSAGSGQLRAAVDSSSLDSNPVNNVAVAPITANP